MKKCIWEDDLSNPPNIVRCINCGIYRHARVERLCNNQNRSIVSKGIGFTKEYTKWKLNGGQYRSDEEIDRIYKICESCEYFKPQEKYGICGICECNLKPSEDKEMNKIAMSTTKCPKTPPEWTEVEGALEKEKKFIDQNKIDEQKKATQNVEPPKKGCGCGRR